MLTQAPAQPARYTFHSDSQLVEDYILTKGVLVDASSPSPVAVFHNSHGESELLAIHKDGFLYHVCREPRSQSGWNMYGVGAKFSSVAYRNSELFYALRTDNAGQQASDSWFWQYRKGRWNKLDQEWSGDDPPKEISLGLDQTLYTIDDSGHLYRYDGGKWLQIPAAQGLTQAPVGSPDRLWSIDGQSHVLSGSSSGGSWQIVGGIEDVQRVFAGADGSIWALKSDGSLYQYQSQQWQRLADAPALYWVAIQDAQTIWGIELTINANDPVHSSFSLVHVSASSGTWEQLPWSSANVNVLSMTTLAIFNGRDGSLAFLDEESQLWLSTKPAPAQQDWRRPPMPTGMPGSTRNVSEVVAGNDPQGNVHGFYLDKDSHLYHLSPGPSGSWESSDALGQCSNLGLSYQDDGKELIVYGMTDDRDLLIVTLDSRGNPIPRAVPTNLPGVAQVSLNAMDSGNWIVSAVVDSTLYAALGTADNPVTGSGNSFWPVQFLTRERLNPTPNNMREVVRLQLADTGAGLYTAVRDFDGKISMVFNLNYVEFSINSNMPYGVFGSYVNLMVDQNGPLKTAEKISGLTSTSGKAHIYATDDDGKLWVIRQTGTTGDQFNPWKWSAWHPLGNSCAHLANNHGSRTTSELFTIGADNTVYLLEQSPRTKHWSTKQVRRPSHMQEEVDYVTQYRTEVTLRDENDGPAAGVAVQISVEEACDLWIGAAHHRAEPRSPVTATTDHSGRVLVSTLALGLHTSSMTFQADGASEPHTVYPPQHCHDFLAGKVTRRNGQTFDKEGRALQQPLDANGKPFDLGGNPPDGVWALAATVIARATNVAPRRAPTEQAAVAAQAAPGRDRAAGSPLDGFWDELEQYAEDVYHAIYQGFFKIVEAKVEDEVLSITLELKNIGQRVLSFALSTIHDIVNAVNSAFQWVKATAEKVLAWLKELFDWHDIWQMKCVFEHLITSPIAALKYGDEQAQLIVANLIKGYKAQVTGYLKEAETVFGSTTLMQLTRRRSNSLQAGASDGGSLIEQMLGSSRTSAHGNWLFSTVMSHLDTGVGLSAPINTALQAALQDFIDEARNSGLFQDLTKAEQDLRDKLLSKLISTPALLNFTVCDLLTELGDLIDIALDLLELTAETALKLIGLALDCILETLYKPLDIPLLSWLYTHTICPDDTSKKQGLRLIDLISLLMAVPGTIAYKLVHHNKPPVTAEQAARIQQLSFHKPSFALLGPAQEAPAAPLGEVDIWKELFAVASVPYLIANSTLDLTSFAQEKAQGTAGKILEVVGWFNCACELALQMCSWPDGPFNLTWLTSWSEHSTARHWADGLWVGGWVPPLFDSAWMLISGDEIHPRASDVGCVVIAIEGLLLLATGVVAIVVDQKSDKKLSDCAIAETVLVPWPLATQWLRIKKLAEASEGISPAVKIGVNIACDIAVPILHVAG